MIEAEEKARKAHVAQMPASPPGSRKGWYMSDCPKHGHTSFNTTVGGCEQCARERLEKEDGNTG